jgi:hypothetical protein
MRIGFFGGAINEGTIDDVVAEARQAEADGFASYWAPNIFGHDALTALAIVGREVPRIGSSRPLLVHKAGVQNAVPAHAG